MPVTAKLTATCDNCGAVHDEIKVVNDPDMHIFDFPLVRRPPDPLFDPKDAGENTDADWMMWPDGVTLCAACEATYRAAVKPQEDVRDALIAPLQEQMQRIREQIRTAHRIHPLPTAREWMAAQAGLGDDRALPAIVG